MSLVHRNSFPKLSKFPWYFTQLGKFRLEANDEKHGDPGKKNRNRPKSHENSRNLLETFPRSRKEENLYGHSDMNNARRILSKGSTPLRGCWFWSKKLHFQKNFGWYSIAVEGITVGTATFFVKVKAHWGELANEESNILADKAMLDPKVDQKVVPTQRMLLRSGNFPVWSGSERVWLPNLSLRSCRQPPFSGILFASPKVMHTPRSNSTLQQKLRTRIYMELSYIEPQPRESNCCYR